jgi:hypothetical protein
MSQSPQPTEQQYLQVGDGIALHESLLVLAVLDHACIHIQLQVCHTHYMLLRAQKQ